MSGAENGAELAKQLDERSGAVSGSQKNERYGAERRAGGRGAVSGLNLPLMAVQVCCPLYSRFRTAIPKGRHSESRH